MSVQRVENYGTIDFKPATEAHSVLYLDNYGLIKNYAAVSATWLDNFDTIENHCDAGYGVQDSRSGYTLVR